MYQEWRTWLKFTKEYQNKPEYALPYELNVVSL